MPGILTSSAGLSSPASLTTPIGTNSGDSGGGTTSLPVSSWRFHLNRRFALMSYRLATTDTEAATLRFYTPGGGERPQNRRNPGL
jgi:hypothetical protein